MLDALTHYIEFAQKFEELAADESTPELKAQLEGQADAYRKLAAKRARRRSHLAGRRRTRPRAWKRQYEKAEGNQARNEATVVRPRNEDGTNGSASIRPR